MKLRCMIVDDEPYAVNLLEEYVAQVPYLHMEHKCYNALEALDFLKNNIVDLVFVDINMPQLSGMQLAALFPPGQPFIFTTAYSEYAVESYDRNAVDYLLKPITFDRFLKAVNKVFKQQQPVGEGNEEMMFLKTGKTIIRLRYDDILFTEGMKDYVVFHTKEGKHIAYKRMKELEENLPARFSRVHNSYIVNRVHIQKIEDNQVWIQGNAIPVSEKYRDSFYGKVNHRLI